jgi:hypothetical protein
VLCVGFVTCQEEGGAQFAVETRTSVIIFRRSLEGLWWYALVFW